MASIQRKLSAPSPRDGKSRAAARRATAARASALMIASSLCVACGGVRSNLELGPPAYAAVPANADLVPSKEYVMGPLDTLNVAVFQEPDLSAQNLQVDAAGNILLPMIGTVRASGRTAPQLADEVRTKLAKYVQRPEVTVTVNSITQKVAIEGSVNQPGVYEIRGRSSLIEALAMARSPSEVAALDQVIVFRTVDGRKTSARFDLRRIRMGVDPDPIILGGDQIVVGFSALRQAWRDFLSTPVFNVFRRF